MPSRSVKNSSKGRGGHSKSRAGQQEKRKVRGGSQSGRFKSSPEATEKEKTGARDDSQSGFMKAAREHPVASAVTGVGAGLLLVEGARRAISAWNSSQNRNGNGAGENRDEEDEAQEDQQEDRQAASRRSAGASDESDESEDEDSESIGEKLQDAGERVSKTTRQAISSLRSGASTLGQQARSAFEQGREIGSEFWEDHPLMIGAIALAAGIALGMLLPSTDTENQWIGKLSDKTAGRAKKAMGEVFEQGKEMFGRAVTESMDTLAREAEREGLTPARLQRKIKRLGAHVRDAVSDAVQ
jgi:ElaB/YqjD/DUF883 family membrane-anchored ribosome-binding protein